MRMYKGYTLKSVLEEDSRAFFVLLDEGFRQESRAKLISAFIAMAPTMVAENWDKFVKDLEYSSKTVDDILITESTPGAEEQLSKIFK